MDERRIAENLQLQSNQGDSSRYMELQPSGEPLEDRWRLQQDEAVSDWQPVEYSRPPKQRPNWILPSLVGVALIGVLTYMAWIGITRLAPGLASTGPEPAAVDAGAETGSEDQQPDNSEQAAPAVQAATDTPVPPPTALPTPTLPPTVAPTPVLVEQRIATVNNEFGVNARLDASTDSDVLRILEFGETATIIEEVEDASIEGNWLQVRTSEGALVWIASGFVDIATQLVPAESGTVLAPVAPAVDDAPLLDVRVIISSPAGLNARSAPDANADIVTILPNDRPYKAVSRSEDGQWIQVQIEDGSLVWIFLQLVIPTADLDSLPVDGEEPQVVAAPVAVPTVATTAATTTTEVITIPAVVTTTSDITSTTAITSTDSVTATAPADTGTDTPTTISPTIVVSSTFGVNARAGTTTEDDVLVILENGAEIPIVGRSADSQWLQVQLDDGRLAWVFAAAILTTSDIATLPEAAPIPATNEPLVPTETVPTTETISPTSSITATDAITGTGAVTATVPATATDTTTSTTTPVLTAPEDAVAKVATLTGAKVRIAPGAEQDEIDSYRINTELKAVGRDDTGEWIAVEVEGGAVGWVFGQNVDLNIGLDELPVLVVEST